MINLDDQEFNMDARLDDNQDFTLDIEDYSGRNFDTDVLDTIVETSHSESPATEKSVNSDDILDEEHWATDSFEELKVDQEY
jgi:hypothetical protein